MLSTQNQGTTIIDFNLLNPGAFNQSEPQSGLHYHFVFSASERISDLSLEQQRKFYGFIANCVRGQAGAIEALGGKGKSINLLVSLNLAQNPADFVKRLKLLTASWARRNLTLANFEWLDEEVATISKSQCRSISRRIEHQSKDFFWKNFLQVVS